MDKIISSLAGLGVLGLILTAAIAATGLAGAASITAALAMLGPGGMVGGVVTLGVAALAAKGIAEYGFDAIFTGVVKELVKRGESIDSMLASVEKYPISKSLKLKVKDEL
ncbi:MAG: hypothetical protein IKG11_05515, partial [Atopobiaceae bacterium]|nr:hypothetical protein [Atopobiaceae bacterium]